MHGGNPPHQDQIRALHPPSDMNPAQLHCSCRFPTLIPVHADSLQPYFGLLTLDLVPSCCLQPPGRFPPSRQVWLALDSSKFVAALGGKNSQQGLLPHRQTENHESYGSALLQRDREHLYHLNSGSLPVLDSKSNITRTLPSILFVKIGPRTSRFAPPRLAKRWVKHAYHYLPCMPWKIHTRRL
jgi:hypothetical protein